MAKRVRTTLSMAAIGLLAASAARAQCISDGFPARTTLQQEFQGADLVLFGRVISQRTVWPHDGKDPDGHETDMIKPTRVFKGSAKAQVRYFSWKTSEGYYLTQGHDYLLFLNRVGAGEYGRNEKAGYQLAFHCGQSHDWMRVAADTRQALARLAGPRAGSPAGAPPRPQP